jgi:hypothetical protein
MAAGMLDRQDMMLAASMPCLVSMVVAVTQAAGVLAKLNRTD